MWEKIKIMVKKVEVYQFKNHFDKYKFYNHNKISFKFSILSYFAPLWKGSFQMVCEKEIEIMIEEVEVFEKVFKK
jgi:hypothetical protein